MRFLLAVFCSSVAFGGQCPSNSTEAFKRFEQIQSVNGAAYGLSGRILFTVQQIENSPREDGSSIRIGSPLQYTINHEILPGSVKYDDMVPVGNTPKPEAHLTYGIEKLLEHSKEFAKTLSESGVTPFLVSEKFKPRSYISYAMFYVTASSNESQTWERNGQSHQVFHYKIQPKPKEVLKREGEKRDRAQFSGDIWLDARTCTPVLLTGGLEDTRWALVDKFEVEFASVDLGFYPTRMFIRTFVTGLGRSVSGVFSLWKGTFQSTQSTELSVSFLGSPNFRPVHSQLLERINRP